MSNRIVGRFASGSQLLVLLVFWMAGSDVNAQTVRVIDGDTLEHKGTTIRLHGIDAPERSQRCPKQSGGQWQCGVDATRLLRKLIGFSEVSCQPAGNGVDNYGRTIAVCHANGLNLNELMVLTGMAWAWADFSTDYVGAEAQARASRLGVWQAPTQTAWDYRAKEKTESRAAEGRRAVCMIKGVYSKFSGGKVYYLINHPEYAKVEMDKDGGDRWFCGQLEALSEGYYPAERW